MSDTALANTSEAPYSVGSDFGKLEARRQRSVGCALNKPGAAATAANPAVPRNLRRDIVSPVVVAELETSSRHLTNA